MKIKITEVCHLFKGEVVPNRICLGIDTAQNNTGYCVIKTNATHIEVLGFYTLQLNGSRKRRIHETIEEYLQKGKLLGEHYISKIKIPKGYTSQLVIEDSWLGINAWTFKVLTKYQVLNYLLFKNWANIVSDPIQPRSARSKIGFQQKTKSKINIKDQIKLFLSDNFSLDIEDDNHADAFIMALAGVIE